MKSSVVAAKRFGPSCVQYTLCLSVLLLDLKHDMGVGRLAVKYKVSRKEVSVRVGSL